MHNKHCKIQIMDMSEQHIIVIAVVLDYVARSVFVTFSCGAAVVAIIDIVLNRHGGFLLFLAENKSEGLHSILLKVFLMKSLIAVLNCIGSVLIAEAFLCFVTPEYTLNDNSVPVFVEVKLAVRVSVAADSKSAVLQKDSVVFFSVLVGGSLALYA